MLRAHQPLKSAEKMCHCSSREGIRVERLPQEQLDFSTCLDALTKFYGDDGCNSSDLERLAALPPVVVCCVGVLLAYLGTFKLEEVLKDTRFFSLSFFRTPGRQRLFFVVALVFSFF